jgi:hypothetical protein
MNSKYCNRKDCGVPLVAGVNWVASNEATSLYVCDTCRKAVNKRNNGNRMTLNGQHVSTKEPYHKPGNYHTVSKGKKEKVIHGFVYIITNPAWPKWVKVGLTTEKETKKRLSSYQTGSPMRDYVVYDEWPVDVAREAETIAHEVLEGEGYERRNEWFKCSPQVAEMMIRGEMSDANTREITTPPRTIRYRSGGDYIKANTEWLASGPEAGLPALSRPKGEEV